MGVGFFVVFGVSFVFLYGRLGKRSFIWFEGRDSSGISLVWLVLFFGLWVRVL